ncbi:MAG: TAXI family TRAP transporter solute-binding subunit [Deltaproteobacteria bacterium]|nr:TAXI family TRAP transporter solute-binding subunit [Deltaproteobacteria bacterium]MBW2129013.1 TAXI family TRAP transporter solute-binding subunit [Deltaproteobacteria bacterium]MBW2304587.1 TAXI family TRAP transporter solute-binding subunit [Deltaproteobacteria bacterium]
MNGRYGRKSSGLVRAAVLVAMLFLFMAQGAWGADWPKSVTVISPAPGASVHMVLVGMGKVIEKYTPIENWIVQPLGGPKLWLPMMKNGQCQFANHNAADILNAFLGRGLYKKMGPMPVRTVGAGHDYMFMFWTTPDTGIKTIADLKGKVVYIKFKANPMFTDMARNQLASAGLSFKDLKSVLAFSSIKEAIRDLIEGRVDALLYPVVPGAVMQVNEAKGECVFVNLTRKQAHFVLERMEGYTLNDIPANDPRFRNKSAIPNAICYQNAMFTSEKTDPEVVYGVVKAIYDHNNEYADTHPAAKYWSLKHRPVTLAVPYHEGSIRYFKEKGLWTPEAQAYQEKMLKRQAEILKKKK